MRRRLAVPLILATVATLAGCTVLVPAFSGLQAASENARTEERGEVPRASVPATVVVNGLIGLAIDAAVIALAVSQLDPFDFNEDGY